MKDVIGLTRHDEIRAEFAFCASRRPRFRMALFARCLRRATHRDYEAELLPERLKRISSIVQRSRRVTEIAVLHCGMTDHAGLLRLISFTRDQTISQSMNRPSNNLVALHHAVVETHVLQIGNDSPDA